MDSIKNYIAATEARNNFFELLARVKKEPYPINITVNGVPEAVIMNKENFDGWMATIETLSDPELMGSIRKGDEDIRAGRYQTLEEVEEEFKHEGMFVADKGRKKYVSSHLASRSKKRLKKAGK